MHRLPVGLALFLIVIFVAYAYGDVASDLQNLGQKFSGQVQQWGQQAQRLGEQAADTASQLAQNFNGAFPTGK